MAPGCLGQCQGATVPSSLRVLGGPRQGRRMSKSGELVGLCAEGETLDRWGDAATRRKPAGARASAPLQLQLGTLKSRVDWYKGPPGLLPGLPHSPHGVQPPQDLPRALQCKREAASTASAAADTKRKAWAELNPTPSLESKSTAL